MNEQDTYTEDIVIDLPMRIGQFVRFQIMVYCQVNGYMDKKKAPETIVSTADIDCLTILGLVGTADLTEFCDKVVSLNIFKTTGSTRNALDRLTNKGLILKEGEMHRRRLFLNPQMGIENREGVLITYRCYGA